MASKRMKPSSNAPAARVRYEKWKKQGSTTKGKLDFYYCNEDDKVELFQKIQLIKSHMGDGNANTITTFEMLDRVVNFYISMNCTKVSIPPMLPKGTFQADVQYKVATKDATSEEMFVCTDSSLKHLVSQVEQHAHICQESLVCTTKPKLRHVAMVEASCSEDHRLAWASSPHVSGGKFLVNLRMAHAYHTSGMLPSHLSKFCSTAGIGIMGQRYLDSLMEGDGSYCAVVQQLANSSMQDAVMEEIGAEEAAGSCAEGISILTDARHCWRKNARFSDVVCLGQRTHKVLCVETVTKSDDPCTQRHEVIGVQRFYQYFEDQGIPIKCHAHDNNASVSKYLREEQPDTENAKDTWHATKGVSRDAKKICAGPAYQEGKVWHRELADKAASLKTGLYFCMKNCGGDADKLRRTIDSIVFPLQRGPQPV